MTNLFHNLISYAFSNDKEKLKEKKLLKYVTASNGLFEIRDTALMTSITSVDKVPNLPEMKEGISLNIPKLPFGIFNKIVAFMKTVYEKDDTESTIMVFYNTEEKTFKLWVPLQENAGASSDYKRDDDPEYTKMCKENLLVMVAHSHPWGSGGESTSSPSPSGTDNKDEKESLLYMIVGNVKGVPTTYVSTSPGGIRKKLNFFDVFKNPLEDKESDKQICELLNKYVPEIEVFRKFYSVEKITIPPEWLARCTKKVHTAKVSYYEEIDKNKKWESYGVDWEEDPVEQYYNRYGVNSYKGYRDYEKDDSYSKSKTSKSELAYGEIEDDDDDRIEFIDIVDSALDLSDTKKAELLYALIDEGWGPLLNACLRQVQKEEKTECGPKKAFDGKIPTKNNKIPTKRGKK